MYSFSQKIRYSEVGADATLTIPGILNYFQDCSTFQSESIGLGVEWLRSHKRVWVVSSWEVKFHRFPKLMEEVVVSTWPYEMKGFFGFRNFSMKDEKGEFLATANSVWTYLDIEKERPSKIDDLTQERYQIEAPLDGEWKGRKISIPEQGIKMESIKVSRQLLDTNGHVNNGKYVLLAMEYVDEEMPIASLRVEYKKSAWLGDEIVPMVCKTKDHVTVVLQNPEGDIFAIVEFERGEIC